MKEFSMENLPLSYDITIRYFDIDANKHVNNAVYFTYMEEARTHLFLEHFVKVNESGLYFVVTEATCKYKKPITLSDKVSITLSTANIKGASFEMKYAFVNPSGELYAEGITRLACVDRETNRLVRLPEDGIEFLSGLSE